MSAPTKSDSRATSNLGGKVVVIGIFVVALLLATFALYWNIARGRRALAFWGSDNVRLIQRGATVWVMPLVQFDRLPETLGNGGDLYSTGDQNWQAMTHIDISKAKGLVHARHALTDDASFEPGDPMPLSAGKWSHVVRFADEKGAVDVLMDFDRRKYAIAGGKTAIGVIPKVADGWKSFVGRQTAAKKTE